MSQQNVKCVNTSKVFTNSVFHLFNHKNPTVATASSINHFNEPAVYGYVGTLVA